jgi:hypothetical protein
LTQRRAKSRTASEEDSLRVNGSGGRRVSAAIGSTEVDRIFEERFLPAADKSPLRERHIATRCQKKSALTSVEMTKKSC